MRRNIRIRKTRSLWRNQEEESVCFTWGDLWSWEGGVGPGQPLNDGILLVTCRGGQTQSVTQRLQLPASLFLFQCTDVEYSMWLVNIYRYRAGPGRCGLSLVEARCSSGLNLRCSNMQPDAPESRFHTILNTTNINTLIKHWCADCKLISYWSGVPCQSCNISRCPWRIVPKKEARDSERRRPERRELELVQPSLRAARRRLERNFVTLWVLWFHRSYRGPGPSSPGSRTGEAVAGLLPIWAVLATEFAVHRALLLLLPCAGRLLAAHPAALPPGLTTGGAAVLPLSSHPAELAEQ